MTDAAGKSKLEGRRRWPYLLVMLLIAPFGALVVGHGAHNWCASELMAAGHGGYDNKRLSISILPPGVRCHGDVGGDGPFEAMWPINW